MTLRMLLTAAALAASILPARPAPPERTMFPPVRGVREMVGAANNFEVEAGFRMLAAGGNAVDAGVAAVLAAAVTEQSRFGLGGEMPLLIKMKGKKVVLISGVGTAPSGATAERYRNRAREPWEEDEEEIPPIPSIGIRAAVVPGVFDGLILALEKFGTKSFAEVAAPAIEYAEGFPLPEEFARFLERDREILELWPASRKFYYPRGRPPEAGEVVRYKRLARTLKELARAERRARGSRAQKLRAVRNYFYEGKIARRIARFSEENGGLITYEDLAGFRASLEKPVSTTYRGYTIYKPGFWSQGPVLLQALNILEGLDLQEMGHNSARYLHTLVEALKLAMADRDRYYGDPKFAEIPAKRLLSKEYAAERRRLIDPETASMEHRPGPLGPPLDLSARRGGPVPRRWVSDTTCVNVADRRGNVFSATPSGAWLPSVIAGDTGIPLSTRLQSFVLTPGHPNLLEPGKRPRITLSPTLVTRGGKPVLIMSTPGGDNQDQATLQVLLNIIEFGMTPQQAVEAARVQSYHLYSSFGAHEFAPGKLAVEERIPPEAVAGLEELGHQVVVRGPWSNSASPTVILIRDGALHGGADPRRARFIFGR